MRVYCPLNKPEYIILINIDQITKIYIYNRSYTCEFVQKVDDNKSDLDDDLCDESIESVRQDENFSKLI